ncbi:phage tail tape measure protein [Microbacterium rhizomatis]|uniref:Phage tail tape measure protein domain-containing protein n=1 Tax=Microbacterium rhizomatis TaxID=1631477 RepID=A0A5J5J268_9MICO|nr:phage tail tape measure protein [Microbacterium rhizomatis]KAA9110186.1 hypothetical protein F6B43_00300 [Microbacterium rhizomatis]
MAGSAKDFILNLVVDNSDADKGWDSFEKSAKGAASAVAAAWGAAGVADVIGGALDSGASNAKVSASLGLTAEESARMGKVSGDLFAQNYGEASDISEAVESVVSSIGGMRNASAPDIQAMTADVINFSKAFEQDVGRSAQIAGQMVTQGLAVDAGQALDLLTLSMQKVPKELRGDLLDAVDEYGGMFNQMGISGEQSMSMLVAASQKGMYGIDKTGDAIKEFAIRATDMSSATQGVYDMLGLNSQEYANMLLAGGEVSADAFNTIVLGLERIDDPATRANAAITLFGTPLEDLGVDGIPKFLGSLHGVTGGLGDVDGATKAMGDTLNDTAQNRIDTMKRGVEGWMRSMVEAGGPLGELTAGAMAFGPGIAQAGSLLAGVTGLLSLFRGATIFGTAATIANTAAQTANNVAWLASPVTWIIIAIIAAIGLLVAAGIWLWQNWDGVTKWIGEAWSNLMGAFENGGRQISDFFGGIPDAIGSAFEFAGNGIMQIGHGVATAFAWLWNNTVGAINFEVPGWVPFIGGQRVSFPQIVVPALAAGGIALGPTLALIGEAGPEAVVPLSRAGDYGLGGGGDVVVPVNFSIDGRTILEAVIRAARKRR